ncbi:PMT family glycosyltransferase, 4-amino-4-deoxy-L-arabinose transferase [Leptolyngbyaceae cyanobacterium JSC-12]|nr:PMT family glycosyltransferase, 4-amino-4-deoxy-L-arabinose transferase [Leptolyngbyaceae cyanobacterium JSC-12]
MVGCDSPKSIPFKHRRHWLTDLPILGGIWLASVVSDRLWLFLDHSTPAWDAADYLTGSLTYWNALQTPQWFSGNWWTNLWLLSSKIPPLVYLSTAPIISLFGKTPDQMILLFLVFSAILLSTVYGLGSYLFNGRVGLWAAGFCVLFPTLYQSRLEFLLDYPLTAMVTLCFLCLTLWRGDQVEGRSNEGDREDAVGKEGRRQKPGDEKSEESQESEGRSQDIPIPDYPSPATQHPSPITHHPSPILASLSSPFFITCYSFLRPFLPIPASLRPWLLAIAFGIALGLALMTKQSAGLFLLVPIAWAGGETIWQRKWRRLAQFGIAFIASLPVWLPWYRTNWLLILTSSKRATIDSAALQGSPSLLSLDAWLFYVWRLPIMVSVPLLLVPLLGLIFFWRRSRVGRQPLTSVDYEPKPLEYRQQAFLASQRSLIWLLIFLVGAYLLSTLNPNKDDRYFAPALPVMSVVLAYGFTLLPRSWRLVQWGSVALAGLLMIVTLFPIFASAHNLTQPYPNRAFPYQGTPYPHAQVIAEVAKADPYLRSTIGVLPSTPAVNQHNVNYYGLTHNFQVYGRQVGTRKSYLEQDRRSLPWFLTKTGDQGSIRQLDVQTAIVQAVEQRGDFKLQKSWQIPDGSELRLFRRKVPAIEVKRQQTEREEGKRDGETRSETLPPVPSPPPASPPPLADPIQLNQVTLPATAPPGQPIPVTYEWSGRWKDLQTGLVLLTWRRQEQPGGQRSGAYGSTSSDRWLHDHGIGMGMLHPETPQQVRETDRFQVIERLAMLPPANAIPGVYILEPVYLNRETGTATLLPATTARIQIDPTAAPTPAPELDLVTQLRSLASTLPKGTQSLERISNEISRINQYDPIQDYLTQAQQAMTYRLQEEPRNQQYAYTLALANVLKRQVQPAIAALERVTQLDSQNPFAYAYLAFVNLYDFRPNAAQTVLDQALKLNPDLAELQALSGIAALMRGNLIQAWKHAQAYQKAEQMKG